MKFNRGDCSCTIHNFAHGGATLFLAGADYERYGKAKLTRRYLLGNRRILKKGDFTALPVNPFFQKESGGLTKQSLLPTDFVIIPCYI
jgi:hypothetical protein